MHKIYYVESAKRLKKFTLRSSQYDRFTIRKKYWVHDLCGHKRNEWSFFMHTYMPIVQLTSVKHFTHEHILTSNVYMWIVCSSNVSKWNIEILQLCHIVVCATIKKTDYVICMSISGWNKSKQHMNVRVYVKKDSNMSLNRAIASQSSISSIPETFFGWFECGT